MTKTSLLIDSKQAGICVLKLCDAVNKNALTTHTLHQLIDVVTKVSRDNSIDVLVIASDVADVFSVGIDKAELKSFKEAVYFSQLAHELSFIIENMKKPTIAAIQGPALGMGLELAMCCDLILASPQARFGFPGIYDSILPGMGGVMRVLRRISFTVAKDILLKNEILSAQRAFEIQLINEIITERFFEYVTRRANSLRNQSKEAFIAVKSLMNEFVELHGVHFKRDRQIQMFAHFFSENQTPVIDPVLAVESS